MLVATARAEALAGPVREALDIVQRALDARLGFDPRTDEYTVTVGCSVTACCC